MQELAGTRTILLQERTDSVALRSWTSTTSPVRLNHEEIKVTSDGKPWLRLVDR
jgi:hypothetical protein